MDKNHFYYAGSFRSDISDEEFMFFITLNVVVFGFCRRRGGEVMAGRRRTSFSGVFITALLAVMLLPGEFTAGMRNTC